MKSSKPTNARGSDGNPELQRLLLTNDGLASRGTRSNAGTDIHEGGVEVARRLLDCFRHIECRGVGLTLPASAVGRRIGRGGRRGIRRSAGGNRAGGRRNRSRSANHLGRCRRRGVSCRRRSRGWHRRGCGSRSRVAHRRCRSRRGASWEAWAARSKYRTPARLCSAFRKGSRTAAGSRSTEGKFRSGRGWRRG